MKSITDSLQADFDSIFHYKIKGLLGRKINDHCRIRIYRRTKTICLMTELKNSGMSVTNCVEDIIPQILNFFQQENNPLPEDTVFIEHYDQDSCYSNEYTESFDVITLNNSRINWQPLSYENILNLIR